MCRPSRPGKSSLQDSCRLHRVLSSAVRGTRPLVCPVRERFTADACWDRQSLVAVKACLRDIVVTCDSEDLQEVSRMLSHKLALVGAKTCGAGRA